ncbi:MAG: epoxyqueuosine reductase QueH [Kiritimatiellae bacterium]|nr:epoxyqueuosine reductase QueH [Kiritimatiellia bacterium]
MSAILLHTCCAPCASACIERLRAERYDVTLFFSNANIGSPAECALRLESVRRLAEYLAVPLMVDPTSHDDWLTYIRGLEQAAEGGARCRRCFAYSLRRTAAKAAELGMPHFTTSLSISPHKHSPTLFEEGRAADPQRFLATDFKQRDGFRRSGELARVYGLYRQNYCGCEFSEP